ncbi:MAG: 4-(cytidine 5'-diphospho)-2-C-methyl-D-erythritol kinase [Hydrotalea sp. AMD]|uniref:4-(cytidine 5'-diphospho)-2-C-methyl-D-erythritol kinase n=1 Tax=Hydrotalea sp. AMD TaxID=2501297 RepID=UPI0009456C19|nr:4-(cytidine 5'-diphospho)-2-C-methyl-D-erythritol kinase [Hydrotalea sp. AMD]RWZ90609.1 MAG: 4-(cytidine 5'-diphospho)-2-C-methyl-D-erythritol kinase [Hydrotalea sp. AMD]
MVVFPNCKINLGLYITKKREDGFHDIATIFYPIQWKDALEIIPNNAASDNSIHFTTSGLPIPGNQENNLCIKAYELLKNDFPKIPPIHLHLHKAIPMGAGLGGGSSDAAAVLCLLNEYFELNITQHQLSKYALQLGSDCPFFIFNQPALATERGETLQPIHLHLEAYSIVLLHPSIHISTAWAFQQIKPQLPETDLLYAIDQPIEAWPNQLFNQFEAPVFKAYPQLEQLKMELYANGALYAAMSGSGSTIYGIFKKGTIPKLNIPKNTLVKIA